MHATITYRLTPAGQKASILSGGDGKADQTITVPSDCPEFPAVVAAADIETDGSVVWSTFSKLPSGFDTFDAPQTAASILKHVAGIAAAKEAKAREAAAKTTSDTLAVLAERKTTTCGRYEGGEAYQTQAPDWPYNSDEAVKASPEALAWIAELEAANTAAHNAAKAIAAEKQAEAKRVADAKAAATAAIRAARGLEDGDLDLNIEDGALTQVPAGCWESHSRGKNWLAIISPDPSAPGGLARQFATKAKGDSYYLLPDWQVGDAVEFGADYYSGRGRKTTNRWYGYVKRIEDGFVVLVEANTGKAAAKAGTAYAKKNPSEVDLAIARVNSEGAIVPSNN